MMDKQPRKFSQFKPGVISRDLHNALGLKITEIPMHIYQMRLYGYPPGWLEDITEYPSGLDFVDSHNSPTEGYDQNITYDVERLVSFPGFNVPLNPRVTDVRFILIFNFCQHNISICCFLAGLEKSKLSTNPSLS